MHSTVALLALVSADADAGRLTDRVDEVREERQDPESGRRIFVFTSGRIDVDLPDASDLERTCALVDDICPGVPAMPDADPGAELVGACVVAQSLCRAVEVGYSLQEWAEITGEPVFVDPGLSVDDAWTDLAQSLDERYEDGSVSFAHAYVLDGDELGNPLGEPLDVDVSLIADGRFYAMQSEASLVQDTMSEMGVYLATEHLGLDMSGAAALGTNSIVSDLDLGSGVEHQWSVTGLADPLGVVPSVAAPVAIDVCVPTGWMLDNFYAPPILWNPTQAPTAPGERIGYVNGTSVDLPDHGLVGLYASSYDPEKLPGMAGYYGPVSQHYHTDLGTLVLTADDGGHVFTEAQWQEAVPHAGGRQYMSGPELLDYIVNLAAVRAEYDVLSADELYSGDVPEGRHDDVAVVVSYAIDWRVNFVLNSDLFPFGNDTHFWHRDVLGPQMLDTCPV